MKAAYPTDMPTFPDAETEMEVLIGMITAIRNIRGEMNIAPSMTLEVFVQSSDENIRKIADAQKEMILDLARLKSLTISEPGPKPKGAATAVVQGATIFVSLEGILDVAQEIRRLEKEIGKIDTDLIAVVKKLQNEDFLAKAPEDVVEKVREKHDSLVEKQEKLQANLDKIKSFAS